MRGSPRTRGRGHDGDDSGGGAENRLLALKLRARGASRCAKARTATKDAAYGCEEYSHGERRQPAPRASRAGSSARAGICARPRRTRRRGRATRRIGLRACARVGRARDRGKTLSLKVTCGREGRSRGERRQPEPRSRGARSPAKTMAARTTSARSAARPRDSSARSAVWA